MRVVVVEDDSLIAMDLVAMVEDLGHEVCAEAHDAAGALAAAEAHQPDAMLMDVNLAYGGSGLDVARAIYQQTGVQSLFISGNVGPELEQKVAALGLPTLGFLCKPVSESELKRLLAGVEAA